jgi:hypothetical protein
MPFLAKKLENEQIVVPMSAEDGQDYRCVSCDRLLFTRPHRSTNSSIARHFCHYDDTGCSGESDVHKHAKMKAVSLLMEIFEDSSNVDEIDWEQAFVVGPSKKQFADAGLVFNQPSEVWGGGIAVEVQHKNTSKKRGLTTQNYLKSDVSVLWLRPHHLLQLGNDAKDVFESMLRGKCAKLKRHRKKEGNRDTYPYIVFFNENVPSKATKRVKSSISPKKTSPSKYRSKPASPSPVYKVNYKSLTPKTEDYHCESNGCLEHFTRIFSYERAGVKVRIKRCQRHGEPSEPEIKTKLGKLRYGI